MKTKTLYVVWWKPLGNNAIPVAICKTNESAKAWIDNHTSATSNLMPYNISEIAFEI